MRQFCLILSFIAGTFAWSQEVRVSLSPEPGKYDGPLEVQIDGEYRRAFYSIDGSVPQYQRRLKESLKLDKTTVVRVRVEREGLSDTLLTGTYVLDHPTKFSMISICVAQEDLWSDSAGIYVKGPNAWWHEEKRKWEGANYHQPWEKEVHMEYFDEEGLRQLEQVCGLRTFGESTREFTEKSLRLSARKSYGKKRFKYPFFSRKEQDKYKHVVLRTSGNDFKKTRFKDALNSHLAADLQLDYQDYRPTLLFVNGQWWGVYNIREKINERFFANNHNVDKDSVDIMMGRWVREAGDWRPYMAMYRWFENLDTMDDASFAQASSMMDVHNYANFKLLQIFINNPDHRGNVRYWRPAVDTGRFRTVFYDTDHSWGYEYRNFIAKSMSPEETDWYNPPWATMYFRRLMEHPEFKDYFLNQAAYFLSTSLRSDNLNSLVASFEERYRNELPRSKKRLARHTGRVMLTESEWQKEVDKLKSFAENRPRIFMTHVKQFFNLETYSVSITGEGSISVNGNLPIALPFEGQFFVGIDMEIVALDSNFASWGGELSRTIHINGEGGDVRLTYRKAVPIDLAVVEDDKDVAGQIVNEDSDPPVSLNLYFSIAFYLALLSLLIVQIRPLKKEIL